MIEIVFSNKEVEIPPFYLELNLKQYNMPIINIQKSKSVSSALKEEGVNLVKDSIIFELTHELNKIIPVKTEIVEVDNIMNITASSKFAVYDIETINKVFNILERNHTTTNIELIDLLSK